MNIAAIYARVSSSQQKEKNTIASQTAALHEFAHEQGFNVPDEWIIEDEGFSGASLLRPGLERCVIWPQRDNFRPFSFTHRTD
ncbi:hypothetical protein XNC3_1920009 [Xenorhabdus nematophila F1]|nr:hypothetical protein XNC3_1920009 [Xenorhabdus nematophila F1]CEK21305.1 protein of unknown function [Xenorhabdus nematophila AN6/1]